LQAPEKIYLLQKLISLDKAQVILLVLRKSDFI